VVRVLFFFAAGCLPFSVFPCPPACLAADIPRRRIDVLCVWPGACTSSSAAAVSRHVLKHSPRQAACQYVEPRACRWPCRPTFSGVPRRTAADMGLGETPSLGRLLIWASVRLLGAGRVDQRSNGGCWAQGVCRGLSEFRSEGKSSSSRAAVFCFFVFGAGFV
jgi:hypothetical protein